MKRRPAASAGFSLVEVALAMGVTAFCLVSMIGLLTVGLTTNQSSSNETQALHVMSQVADDLQAAAQGGLGKSLIYGFTLPANGSGNTMTSGQPQSVYVEADGSIPLGTSVGSAPVAGDIYRVTLGFSPPTATTGLTVGPTARILVSWPAAADPTPTAWPTSCLGRSVQTVFVLNKN